VPAQAESAKLLDQIVELAGFDPADEGRELGRM